MELSQYFVENNTVACDIGCATGRTLAAIRARNQERAPGANYIGLDIEPSFRQHGIDSQPAIFDFYCRTW